MLGSLLSIDIYTLATLRESVSTAVYHTPLNRIAKLGQAGQNDGEVAAALTGRALKQAVDVFEQNIAWLILKLKESVDVPPQNTLLAFNATRHRQGLCNRVVLAGEPTHDHIDIGDADSAGLE